MISPAAPPVGWPGPAALLVVDKTAVLPGTGGISLSPGRIDAEGGTVQLQVYDPSLAPEPAKPSSLVVDVSTKPLISLVWIGTILVVIGIMIALFLRRNDIATIPVEG